MYVIFTLYVYICIQDIYIYISQAINFHCLWNTQTHLTHWPLRGVTDFQWMILQHILAIDFLRIPCEADLKWMLHQHIIWMG